MPNNPTHPVEQLIVDVDHTLKGAIDHHQGGRLKEAEGLYRAILQVNPCHPDANHNLGILAVQTKQPSLGLVHFKLALEANPKQGQYWISYIEALMQTGQIGAARQVLDQGRKLGLDGSAVNALVAKLKDAPTPQEIEAIATLFGNGLYHDAEVLALAMTESFPLYGEGWKVLGTTLKIMGRSAEALPSMQKAAELLPTDANVFCIIGTIFESLGKITNAESSYLKAIELRPDYAEAYNNYGAALYSYGRLAEAEINYRKAIEFRPNYAEAFFNLGLILQKTNQLGDSVDCYRKVISIKPDYVEAHSCLGIVLHELGQLVDAEACYQRALAIKPDYSEPFLNMGSVLKQQCRVNEAKLWYQKASQLGVVGASVREALLLPPVMGTIQEVLDSRIEFERKLDQLILDKISIDDPIIEVGDTNFYLAYHGLNDLDLQIKVAKFYEKACPSLLYSSPFYMELGPLSQQKIRIGFLSKFLYDHSVSRCFGRVIEEISQKENLEVILISSQTIDGEVYSRFHGTKIRLPENLNLARQAITELKLNILVYLDIGMDPLSYFLAFSRLAAVQCVMGGHPITTGISNVDYFLSCGLVEPKDADKHYSEKLILLKHLPIYYKRPDIPNKLKTRTELALPEDLHLYICPMRIQKIHPEFDEAITRILQMDVEGVVVLFEDILLINGKDVLRNRFNKTIPANLRERIIFMPWLKNQDDFISAIAAADVILDPFHFGIGSTAVFSFAVGTPMVTKAGEFMRGRVGMGYCKLLDLDECITEDTESYSQKAVQIASNKYLQIAIRKKILNNNHVIFETLQPVDELIRFFVGEVNPIIKTDLMVV